MIMTTMQLRHTSLTGFKRKTPSPGSCTYTACSKVLSGQGYHLNSMWVPDVVLSWQPMLWAD